MANGPGTPAIELALRLMARKRIKDDEAKKASNKNKSSQDDSSVYTDKLKDGEEASGFNDPEYIKKNYKAQVQPAFEKSDKDVYIRSGLAIEKDGDFFLTPRYYELNKDAKIDSFIKEFERREKLDEKFVNERAGKGVYEKNKMRMGNAKESMKNWK
jgi:hypothetical protein